MQRLLGPLRRQSVLSPPTQLAVRFTSIATRSNSVADRATTSRPHISPSWLPHFLDFRQPSQQQPQTQRQQSTNAADGDMLKAVEASIGSLTTGPLGPPAKPVVVVISGPSGVGKDAVILRLKQARPDLYFVVTATSRAMRPGEVDGRDYFFVSKERFEEWRRTDQLLESAVVYGEYKGIPRQQVDQALVAGTDVVLRIDVQGAASVRRLMPDVVSIFITAESEQRLVQRLVNRKTEPLDKMLVRVQTARDEASRIPEFDYVVVNRDGQLDACVAQIAAIIDAEKCRVHRLGHALQAAVAAAPAAS